MQKHVPIKIGIAGLGAIGLALAKKLDAGVIEGLQLAAVSARDTEKAARNLAQLSSMPAIIGLAELPQYADVVVECVPAKHFREIAEPTIAAGRIFMPLSVGQLLENMDLVDRARETGGRIVVPTGALIGLDAVRATAEDQIERVTLVTRKPPGGLAGAPHLEQHNISVEGLTKPLLVFKGTAREAGRGFPANLNVAVALSLAGSGPDKTDVEIWADPTVTRNTHTITLVSNSSNLTMTIENIPSENPRTGRITALSVLAALRRLTSPLVVGT